MGKQFLDGAEVSSLPCKGKLSPGESIVYSDTSSPTTTGRKTVKFSSLTIRSHAVVLGDHPCCSSGCPLELSWEHEGETELSIDEYETSRPQRRSRNQMRTTWLERREWLSEYSDGDVRRQNRKLQRSRRCCNELSSFFLEVQDV